MLINERKELRCKILQELYEAYFEKNGAMVLIEKNTLDNETRLAYIYLADKGYIEIEVSGRNWGAKISVHGIDLIENQCRPREKEKLEVKFVGSE